MLLRTITGLSLFLAALIFALREISLWLLPLVFASLWLGLLLLAFLFLVAICAAVDPKKPQEHDSRFYRTVMHWYIQALIPLVRLEVRTQGLEKTPKEGRFLLVCNHQNESDPGILLHYFKSSQLAFVSKRENKTMFAVGKFMHKTMCQLVNRENDREALKTIVRCIQLIREDETSVAVFPEGGILVKDKLSHFRPGVFKIAQKAQVPIVVCTLKGTRHVLPNLPKLKHTDVALNVLEVIAPEELTGITTAQIADRVYHLMADDLGPENVAEE